MNTPLLADRLQPSQEASYTEPTKLFIGGAWVPAQSGETFDVINPSTGGLLARVASGGKADIDQAVRAARQAFQSAPWAKMRSAERTALLLRLADAIERNADELARIESRDGGNPLKSVRHVDIVMAIAGLRYQAGWATKMAGEIPLAASGVAGFSYSLREPIGVAGLITPWNAPFLMAVNKLGAALAAGCTCVLKPAELAPLSALWLGGQIAEVGFPEGVVNIVTGLGGEAGQALVDHPDVNKISFTGSTRVGRSILQGAAGNMKRVTLELGGKSPVIVFPDADLERATQAVANEIFFKTGQFCAAGTRLFVHEKAFDQVVEGIADRARKLKVGDAQAPDTEMGPIISEKQLARVTGFIEAGRNQGAAVIVGGNRIAGDGFFIEPTVLTNTGPDSSVMQEEIFGPVLCAVPFNEDGALDRIAAAANNTAYGLAAKIWTRDLRTAHEMARKIQAGSIIVNGGGGEGPLPFGGYKQSGLGRENAREGILSYTEIKSVSIGF